MPGPMFVRAASLFLVAVVSFIFCARASAQPPVTPPDPVPVQAPVKTVELDQAVVNVPTTMPLPRHKSYFRITHRFTRDFRRGSLGQLAEDGLGLDNGAIIGLEYRFGVTSNLQAGIHRSILGKTIHTFAKWDVRRQAADGLPFGLSVIAGIEAQNNLQLDPQPGISATFSRTQGTRLALYAAPTYIHDAHTPTLRLAHEGHDHGDGSPIVPGEAIPGEEHHDTVFIGLGARLRIRETVSLVGEVSPRVFGYRPDRAAWNVAIEKLTRGHVLQLNFGNNFDSTPGMVARGGSKEAFYMGFNMSRKF
jgi:hypothetical protein